MAFNGSGTYVLPGAALVDGGTVSATEHNALRNDLATALTTCLTRDGQSPATANLPMGGFKLTGLAAGTGTGESARYDELNAHITDSTDAHAASAITNTPAGTIAATTVQEAINELDTDIGTKAADSAVVKLTGDQTVAGIKTFSSAIVGSTNSQVSLTGNQTIAGVKTFSSPVGVAAATADGDAVQLAQLNTLMTAQATTSGTSIDFTGIPSWVKRITVMLIGVSTNGTGPLQIQLGDSGGVETTGYASTACYVGATVGATTSTTGLLVSAATSAPIVFTGNIEIVASSGVDWTASGVFGRTDPYLFIGGGGKTLSGTLDRIRLTTVNGTDAFDAGSVNVMYS